MSLNPIPLKDYYFDSDILLGPIVGEIHNGKTVIVINLFEKPEIAYNVRYWFDNNETPISQSFQDNNTNENYLRYFRTSSFMLQYGADIGNEVNSFWSRFDIEIFPDAKICYYQIFSQDRLNDNKEKNLTSILSFACPQKNIPLKMAVVSCNNKPQYSVKKQFEDIFLQNPQVLVHLGDQVYMDDLYKNYKDFSQFFNDVNFISNQNLFKYSQKVYEDNFNRPEQRIVMATRSNIMLYDDHEFIDDVIIDSSVKSDLWIKIFAKIPVFLNVNLMTIENIKEVVGKYDIFQPSRWDAFLSRKLKWNNNELWIVDTFSQNFISLPGQKKNMLREKQKVLLNQWKEEYQSPNNVFILTQRPLLYGTAWVNSLLSSKVPSVQIALKDTWDGPNGKYDVLYMLDFCNTLSQKMSNNDKHKYPLWVGGDVHEYLDTSVTYISSSQQILEQVVSSPLSSPPAFSGQYGGWKETVFDWLSVKSSQFFKWIVGPYFIDRIKTVRQRNWVLFTCPLNTDQPQHQPFFYGDVRELNTVTYILNFITQENIDHFIEFDEFPVIQDALKENRFFNAYPMKSTDLAKVLQLLKTEDLQNIREVNISTQNLFYENEQKYANAMMQSSIGPNVEFLKIDSRFYSLWFPFIQKCKNLKGIDLNIVTGSLNNDNLQQFLDVLPPTLTRMDLRGNDDIVDVTPVVNYLKAHPQIKDFKFSSANAINADLLTPFEKPIENI